MNRRIAAAMIWLSLLPLVADETPKDVPSSFGKHQCVGPKLVPASPTVVVTGDVLLQEINLINESASAVTVTIIDGQQSPLACGLPSAVSIAAHTAYEATFGARICPSGITWSASSGTAVVGYIRWRQ